jgi:hypothetical protein
VQQCFDAPTCGSLYRGHLCTMGTHWAPSLCLVLCCLVPLPPCANRTYYYYIWTVGGGVLAAHTQGSSLRGCAWFHVVEGCTGHVGGHPAQLSCLALAHGCHRTIVPVTDSRAASPPGTVSHVCARMCCVQQCFDAPTCGSLYRGHLCTMSTHWAPSLCLVLCFLVPLPPCANRTYYYYIWTVGGVLAAHTQGSSLRGCTWFHVVEGCTGPVGGHPAQLSCLALAHGCHRTIVPVTDSRAASPPGLRPMCVRECAVCSNLLMLPPADPCTGVTCVQWARTGHPHYTWRCAS